MAKGTVEIKWLPKGCMAFFKYSDEVASALKEAGDAVARKNSANAARYIHDKRGFTTPAYDAEVRRLERTQVCVVHASSNIAAAIGRKHRLPKK